MNIIDVSGELLEGMREALLRLIDRLLCGSKRLCLDLVETLGFSNGRDQPVAIIGNISFCLFNQRICFTLCGRGNALGFALLSGEESFYFSGGRLA